MRAEIDRFDLSVPVEQAVTPPSSWYTDPGFHDHELRAVFRRSWQPVGRLDQLSDPGDYTSGLFAGEPYVMLRDHDGELRAFFNVCRHHATCVAEGDGKAERLVCPYHGWTYDLDGRLRKAPRMAGVKEFDRERFGLQSMEAGAWGPFACLRIEPGGEALAEWMRPLAGKLDLSGLRFVTRKSWEIACNWKVYVDNYLDGGYHVSHLHRGLAGQLDLDSYRTEIEGKVSLQICGSGDHSVGGETGEGLDFNERLAGGAVYAFVHPNFMINRYGPMMDTNWVVPLGPERCLTVFDYYFEERLADDDAFIERSLVASDQVQQEDIDVCERVQRGLRSSSYDVGCYAPQIEQAAHAFHCWLAADLRSTRS